ncbi:MAG: hypothetical protein GX362_03340 [Methanosarcinaceae archaeon]|nr:hypothetical protein [Methanosarcinaceae archaeon]
MKFSEKCTTTAATTITETTEAADLKLNVYNVGNDFVIILTGGEKHVGAVALGQVDKDSKRSFGSVLTSAGHKEDEIALFGAKLFSKYTKRNVVFICGIHVDEITHEQISEIDEKARSLICDAVKEVIKKNIENDTNIRLI